VLGYVISEVNELNHRKFLQIFMSRQDPDWRSTTLVLYKYGIVPCLPVPYHVFSLNNTMNVEFSDPDPHHVDEDRDLFTYVVDPNPDLTFIFMQIRIRLLSLIRIRIWILHLMKVM
jgi:hypothetical protein